MASGDEQKFYPKGRLSKGAGDLVDVTECTVKASKGRKQVGTLRNPTSGVTNGEETNELTFKCVLSQDGFERDFEADYQKDKFAQYRLKVPGKTYTINGMIDDLEITSTKDGAIEFSAKVIGSRKAS